MKIKTSLDLYQSWFYGNGLLKVEAGIQTSPTNNFLRL